MARDDPKFMLRMPAALKAQVEESARESGRSMNAEIVHRLELTFGSPVAPAEMLDEIGRLLPMLKKVLADQRKRQEEAEGKDPTSQS